MSTNITNAEIVEGTGSLRVSRENAAKLLELELPEGFGDQIERIADYPDGFAKLPRFDWSGESSGTSENDGTLRKAVALIEGDADVIFTWEGGDFHSGLRIRGGKMTRCEVVMALAPEKPAKTKRAR